jgi:hypothetical protein
MEECIFLARGPGGWVGLGWVGILLTRDTDNTRSTVGRECARPLFLPTLGEAGAAVYLLPLCFPPSIFSPNCLRKDLTRPLLSSFLASFAYACHRCPFFPAAGGGACGRIPLRLLMGRRLRCCYNLALFCGEGDAREVQRLRGYAQRRWMVVGSLLDRIKEGGVGIANELLISLDDDGSLQGCGFSLL